MTIPFLSKRIIYPTKKDLQTLLLCSDIDHPPALTDMEPETLQQLTALDTGSVAFIYEEKQTGTIILNLRHFFGWEKWNTFLGFFFISIPLFFLLENTSPNLKLEIVGWKGKASVRAYVPKNDRIHYLRLIGGDTSKYEFNKFEAKRETEESKNQADQKLDSIAN